MAGILAAKMKRPMEEEEEGAPEMEVPEAADAPEMEAEAPEAAPPGRPPTDAGGDPNVQRVVLAAQQVLYDEQTMPAVLNVMRQLAKQPAAAMGKAAFLVMRALYEKSNKTMPKEVIAPAAERIIGLLHELAEAAGLFQAPPDQDKVALAVFARELRGLAAGKTGGQPPGQPPGQAPQPMQPHPGVA